MKRETRFFWIIAIFLAIGCVDDVAIISAGSASTLASAPSTAQQSEQSYVEINWKDASACKFEIVVRNPREETEEEETKGHLTVTGTSFIKIKTEQNNEFDFVGTNGDRNVTYECDAGHVKLAGHYLLTATFSYEDKSENVISKSATMKVAVVPQTDKTVKTGSEDQLASLMGTEFYRSNDAKFDFGVQNLVGANGTLLVKANALTDRFEPRMEFSAGEAPLFRKSTITFEQMQIGESRVIGVDFFFVDNSAEGDFNLICKYDGQSESLPFLITMQKNAEGGMILSANLK